MRTSHTVRLLSAAALLLATSISSSLAQAPYPKQPIRIICAFPAGGGTDLTARLLGEQLQKILGQ